MFLAALLPIVLILAVDWFLFDRSLLVEFASTSTMSSSSSAVDSTKKSVHDFTVKKADGTDQALSEFKGKAMLIVNTASQCGFTPQYAGLQALHKDLGDQLAVLAFPCNQFGAQEPGNDEEIQQFCKRSYDVDFPVFKKINVNGDNTDPLWQFLKSKNIN
jgi:glutathione peroxidase-family protein